MDSKKIVTGLGIAGGIIGIVGGLLGACQTIDQMKNGVKLRQDQLDSISNSVSLNIINNYDSLAASIVAEFKQSDKE